MCDEKLAELNIEIDLGKLIVSGRHMKDNRHCFHRTRRALYK